MRLSQSSGLNIFTSTPLTWWLPVPFLLMGRCLPSPLWRMEELHFQAALASGPNPWRGPGKICLLTTLYNIRELSNFQHYFTIGYQSCPILPVGGHLFIGTVIFSQPLFLVVGVIKEDVRMSVDLVEVRFHSQSCHLYQN